MTRTRTRIDPATATRLAGYNTVLGGIRSDSDADITLKVLLDEGANVGEFIRNAQMLALRYPRHKTAKRIMLGAARVQLRHALLRADQQD